MAVATADRSGCCRVGGASVACAADGISADTELARMADLRVGSGNGCAVVAAVVGARHYGGGIEEPAEHYCGAVGRFGQYGDRRCRIGWQNATRDGGGEGA